ncbi:unnamed protein product [Linum trigynum]|uniref:Uncharacterized protein n=1 Tax=Linum trigynum TaxID=586398 RepID=A0AAV2E956_9ROSI
MAGSAGFALSAKSTGESAPPLLRVVPPSPPLHSSAIAPTGQAGNSIPPPHRLVGLRWCGALLAPNGVARSILLDPAEILRQSPRPLSYPAPYETSNIQLEVATELGLFSK